MPLQAAQTAGCISLRLTRVRVSTSWPLSRSCSPCLGSARCLLFWRPFGCGTAPTRTDPGFGSLRVDCAQELNAYERARSCSYLRPPNELRNSCATFRICRGSYLISSVANSPRPYRQHAAVRRCVYGAI